MRQRAGQRGAALLFSLMVLVILSIGTSVLWQQVHGTLRQHRIAWHQEQAFQLAEAGLETAVAQLRETAGAYRGEKAVALGPGRFSVVVTPDDSPDTYVIHATGRLDHAAYHYDTARLKATLTLDGQGQIRRYAWHPVRGEDAP